MRRILVLSLALMLSAFTVSADEVVPAQHAPVQFTVGAGGFSMLPANHLEVVTLDGLKSYWFGEADIPFLFGSTATLRIEQIMQRDTGTLIRPPLKAKMELGYKF